MIRLTGGGTGPSRLRVAAWRRRKGWTMQAAASTSMINIQQENEIIRLPNNHIRRRKRRGSTVTSNDCSPFSTRPSASSPAHLFNNDELRRIRLCCRNLGVFVEPRFDKVNRCERYFSVLPSSTSPTTSSEEDPSSEKKKPARNSTTTTTTTTAVQTTIPPKPLSLQRAYRYLQLETFSRQEMSQVYDRIVVASYVDTVGEEYAHDIPLDTDTSSLDQSALELFMRKRIHELELESDQRLSSFAAEGKETSFCLSQQADFDTDRQQYAAQEAAAILTLLRPNPADAAVTLTKQRFVDRLTELASAVDRKRSAPVFLSMLLVGASVGVVTPAMPFIVQALELNASQYGAAVSAFALAKMLGNVPAAIAVERHGRKPYMTYSLAVIALGVGGIGWAGSFEELYACRLLTGLGVAALSTAGTLMVTDLSTPLNRASTYAPIMSAFAAGTALGPALGGMLVDQLGLHATFYAVGVSYLGVALLNRSILSETKSQPIQFPWQKQLRQKEQTLSRDSDKSQNESLGSALNGAVGQWVPLLKDPAVRSVMIMNGIYWIALAGSQMTLLPLMLTDVNGLAFTATQVGQVYMGMSLVQIVGNPVFARISDTVGKVPVIVGATTLISAAMLALPYFCGSGMGGQEISMVSLAGTLGVWSMGSSMLSTAPLAYVSDRVDEAKRAQAIALLRTCGDVGFLLGATGSGALADWAGNLDVAMQSSAGLLLTATAWFTARQILTRRLEAAAGAAAATMERRDR